MQNLIVVLIVAMAASYALWKYMPKNLRRIIAKRGAAWAQRSAKLSAENARRLEDKLSTGGGCGSCDGQDNCGKACNASDIAIPPLALRGQPEVRSFIPIYAAR